ncbi:S41 family peptidase [Brucella sp. IR073]|uniref:S41 family peptidase n=1 Tax=unclassified Brucella TaxID=2632610 RepID=UPI003B97DE3D
MVATRVGTINAICTTLRENFFDPGMTGVDWSAACDESRRQAQAAKSDEQFWKIAANLPAQLKISHTAYYGPTDPSLAIVYSVYGSLDRFKTVLAEHLGPPQLRGAGIFAKLIDGRLFIENILDGSPAEKAGLKEGDELVQPGLAVFAARWPDRKTMTDPETTTVQFRRTQDGPIQSRTMKLISDDALRVLSHATENSVRLIERDGVKIGYLRGWAMLTRDGTGGPATALRAALSGPFASADAVILDARGRIGGGGMDILQTYFGPRIAVSFKGRQKEGWTDYPVMPYGKPLVIIIDGHTRSAAEIMAYAAKKQKLALLVGSRTAGAVAAGSLFPLPDGGGLYVAVAGIRVDGEALEGKGVEPDIVVERPLPYAGGSDPQLERAVYEAVKQVK